MLPSLALHSLFKLFVPGYVHTFMQGYSFVIPIVLICMGIMYHACEHFCASLIAHPKPVCDFLTLMKEVYVVGPGGVNCSFDRAGFAGTTLYKSVIETERFDMV